MTVVLLASGGLDSTLIAATRSPDVHLFIDYGQRHAGPEFDAAEKIAAHYGGALEVVAIRDVSALLPSSLTGRGDDLAGVPTVVPNRNALLIALAVGVCDARGGGTALIGCNASDRDVYPDCRPAFIFAANWQAELATEGRVSVEAPLLDLTKRDIGRLARANGVPIDMTWSCYAGDLLPCGVCGACEQRREALRVHHHEAL